MATSPSMCDRKLSPTPAVAFLTRIPGRRRYNKFPAIILLIALCIGGYSFCADSLFYFEAQAIAGYSSLENKMIFYSMNREEAMQKPSLGFDFIKKFSGERGDWAMFAAQLRLAYNADAKNKLEIQLYNAFLKIKTRFADAWIGHNRPEFGLSSYLDSHALLLQTLSMNGFGFDRDWGVGLKKDLRKGTIGVSFTAGSGMPLILKGNYLVCARAAYGVLEQDNYNIGISAALGNKLVTMGYHLMMDDPQDYTALGADLAFFRNNLENRLELAAKKEAGRNSFALSWRVGLNLLAENRLKLELQPVFLRNGGSNDYQVSTAVSFTASGNLTLRTMLQYDRQMKDTRLVFQVYYYQGITL